MTNASRAWSKLAVILLLCVAGWLAVGTASAFAAEPTITSTVTSTVTSAAAGTVTSAAAGTAAAPADAPVHLADGPAGPKGPKQQPADDTVTVNFGGLTDKPSTPIVTILGLTLLSLAPAILLTTTSFTKILVVLGLTRNALGLQQTPPNQVLAGLALFLSFFVMAPVLSAINDAGVQPYLDGEMSASQAWDKGIEPLREFMVENTDDAELTLLTNVADRELPENIDDVALSTLVPAFILTELKQAFIIGFIIFIPFLVIDIVVSGALMALGMMMMPPVMVSLPFKLLLFVLVDGWALVIKSLVASYG